MTAIAVMVLVIESIRKTVSSSTGVPDSTSATPCPWNHARDPSRTTPTARPATGQRLRTSATLLFNSGSSIDAVTPSLLPEPHHGARAGRIAGRWPRHALGQTPPAPTPLRGLLPLAGYQVTVTHTGPVP